MVGLLLAVEGFLLLEADVAEGFMVLRIARARLIGGCCHRPLEVFRWRFWVAVVVGTCGVGSAASIDRRC